MTSYLWANKWLTLISTNSENVCRTYTPSLTGMLLCMCYEVRIQVCHLHVYAHDCHIVQWVIAWISTHNKDAYEFIKNVCDSISYTALIQTTDSKYNTNLKVTITGIYLGRVRWYLEENSNAAVTVIQPPTSLCS